MRWLLALAVLALGATDAPAQFLWPGGFGYGYGRLGFGFLGPRGRFALYGRAYVGGFGYLGGFGIAPFGYLRNQVTVIYTPPPIVLMPPPRLFLDELDQELRPPPRREVPPVERVQPPPEAPEPLPKGDEVGGFRPLDPDNRARARQPMPDQPKPEPPPEPLPPPPPKPPPRPPNQPPELPHPPMPETDPQAEYARLIDLGRAAFAAGEYGRAAQRFRQAADVDPREPFAHFLLAQALFALGKYADAADAIHAGLDRQPAWPTSRFRPMELYGANVADYAAHLRRLEDTLRRRPDDPILLFLYAYQLWFDGRREEARPFFQRAREKAADRGDIERFLRALPAAPVL
jgi:hypothetical protein